MRVNPLFGVVKARLKEFSAPPESSDDIFGKPNRNICKNISEKKLDCCADVSAIVVALLTCFD